MPARLNLVILGKQGAGKGTQCKRLAASYGIPHISTGDILRGAVKAGTPLGLEVASVLESGALVSDDLVIELVKERFDKPDAQQGLEGLGLSDGAGEPVEEAPVLGADGIKLCVNLDVPIELVTERLSSRRVCQECGAIYREGDVEAISGTCSICGGDVVQRDDDQPDSIRRRLESYERDTEPLLAFYETRGLLVTVNGDQSPDAVTEAIEKVVRDRGLA
jgi:adenylate kinase